jgi:DNA-binding transcriptional ArsR family regulator
MVERYKTPQPPSGLEALAAEIVTRNGGAPRGNLRSGWRCCCPAHRGNDPTALSVSLIGNGLRFKCFSANSCTQKAIRDALRRDGLDPGAAGLQGKAASSDAEEKRSSPQRRTYAAAIWEELATRESERPLTYLLAKYTEPRGLSVPATALIHFPLRWSPEETDPSDVLSGDDPAMVLPIRDKTGQLQGIQATWLDWGTFKKREREPKRQTYGGLKGNFIELVKTDYARETPLAWPLIIGEGTETVLSAITLTGLPGIATGGNVANVDPPEKAEYIVLVDCDDKGVSREAAGRLARKLLGGKNPPVVRLATPVRPEGAASGFDWNDVLVEAGVDEAARAALRTTILEAPEYAAVRTIKDKLEERMEELAALRARDRLEYALRRKSAAKEFDIPVGEIDLDLDRRAAQREPAGAPPPPDMKKLEASAQEIIESDDVLKRFARECASVVVGEGKVIQLLYLICTSRLFDKTRTMHAVVKGTSAGGKSKLRQVVVDHFPPESVVSFTAMSEKALLYVKGDFVNKILSMSEASAMDGKGQEFQNYLIREMISEGKVTYNVPQKVGDKIETNTIEIEGPVSFLVTTTRNALHAENETRLLSIEIDDSAKQTRAIMEKTAETVGLLQQPDPASREQWHDYQRWLAGGELRVVVPFALVLAKLIRNTKSPRLRRDFPQLLVAIQAHALLHRASRQSDDRGRIVAEIGDYEIVRWLMADILATGVELKVQGQVVKLIDAMEELNESDGVTVRALSDKLNLGGPAVRRWLAKAEYAGYVENSSDKKGARFKGLWKLTGEKPNSGGDLLPSVEKLQQAFEPLDDDDDAGEVGEFPRAFSRK